MESLFKGSNRRKDNDLSFNEALKRKDESIVKTYEQEILKELRAWQREMTRPPTFADRISKNVQNRANSLIPKKAHDIMTTAIKNMVIAVLTGSEYITRHPVKRISLQERERMVQEKITFYKRTASLEGAGTGAGGILLGFADFPLLLSIKMKFLFDAASIYGFDVREIKERLYVLHLFQLAFSSRQKRITVYRRILDWDWYINQHPPSMESVDWRVFQQEYRDYIDLAKFFQLVPGIGAIVGAFANYKLLNELGQTAMNGYRLRLLTDEGKFNSKYDL